MPLRWWIGGLLFASTTINYIDRQALNVLAPYLKTEYHWTNSDFASIVIAFRLAYALMQWIGGRAVDRLGTRRGLSLAVAWYSVAAMATSLAGGLWSFRLFRFLLGVGEAANWPAATKAVAEWFPPKERGWAVALFDSGSAIGGAVAPSLVVWLYHRFGTWRPSFVITGLLGFFWLAAWRAVVPAAPPQRLHEAAGSPTASWGELLRHPQTWGVIALRALLDPYWFLIADWFALFLVSKGFRIEDTLFGFWLPFLSADFGNFFGGGFSSWLIGRGWSILAARRAVYVVCGPMMLLLIPAAFTSHLVPLLAYFAVATFGYAACSTMHLVLPSDLFASGSVGTVSGMAGMVTGMVTIASTYAVGAVTDRYSFAPVLLAASAAPLLAMAVAFLVVRNTRESGQGVLLRI
ncbi:MAG: MFS transporter [Candidatus Solibacter usitatus]|nr:MFS transporter [Candidatus Solibacter usitatus]